MIKKKPVRKDIQAGSVVTMKSGGSKMTVESVDIAGWTAVVWFSSERLLHKASLKSETLKLITP
jgi:uncharacterized protein YodC (DUF2158 family)